MNPQRIATLVLIFSDVVLALVVLDVASMIRAAWGTSTIAGVLPTNPIAGVLPVTVLVSLRAVVGLYPGFGLNAVEELRRQSYATLGALIIASTFLGLHQGQDVSRSVLIGGFLALLITAPLVRQLVKWSLKKARLWGTARARESSLRLTRKSTRAGLSLERRAPPCWPILVALRPRKTYPELPFSPPRSSPRRCRRGCGPCRRRFWR